MYECKRAQIYLVMADCLIRVFHVCVQYTYPCLSKSCTLIGLRLLMILTSLAHMSL